MCPRCEKFERAAEVMQEALERIKRWGQCSYPTDIFHDPTPQEAQRAHKLLVAHGMTLDAFSADMGRHCLKGVSEIAEGALAEADVYMKHGHMLRPT